MKKQMKQILCLVLAVAVLAMLPSRTAKADSGDIEDFVTRLYTLCLNRTPDEDGLNDWCTLLSNGSYTGTQVAHGFVFSDEFIASDYSDEEFVQQMYRIFLGREYDQEGMGTWLGLMRNNGYGREAIFNGFSQSVEFGRICTDYGIEQGGAVGKVADDISSFVIRFYQVFLGRGADPSGLQTWTTALKSKTMSAAEVAQGFVFSDEFLSKNYDDASFVKYMYTAFLDRGADEEGLQTWTDCLKNGWTREQVFDGFVDSNEFARICEEYGISRDGEEEEPGEMEEPEETPDATDEFWFEYEETEDENIRITGLKSGAPEEIVIPGRIEGKKVTEVGDEAFLFYEQLKKVKLNEGLEVIGEFAFYYCNNLESVIIPKSVKVIGAMAFGDCVMLSNVELNDGLEVIGEDAFSYCDNLERIVLPDTLAELKGGAFFNCRNLKSVKIPNNKMKIGREVFYQCSEQMVFEVDETNGFYAVEGGVLFSKDKTELVQMLPAASQLNYTIPSSVRVIGCSAFAGCNLEEVAFPIGLLQIGDGAFAECNNLKEVSLPNTVTSIGKGAFEACDNLMKIVIPESVVSIGEKAFAKCSRLNIVTAEESYAEKYAKENSISLKYVDDSYTLIYEETEDGNIKVIEVADDSIKSVIIPSYINGKQVVEIGNFAFEYCTELESVIISEGVTKIGVQAFHSCEKIVDVVLPNSLCSIDKLAFKGCKSLANITIPGKVTEIGGRAFGDCTELESVIISEGVTKIGDSAFYLCENLSNIVLPDSLYSIGELSFYGCKSLVNITIPGKVTEIGERAFSFCNIESIIIPSSVTLLSDGVFSNCGTLKEVTLNDGLEIIGDDAFYGCSALEEIVLPDTLKELKQWAFFGCENLKTVKMPNNKVKIDYEVFYGCSPEMVFEVDAKNEYYVLEDGILFSKDKTELIRMLPAVAQEEYVVPTGVVSIGCYAFEGCELLKSIILPEGLQHIGKGVFDSTRLERIFLPDSVTVIDDGAFETIFSLRRIDVGKGNLNYVSVDGVLYNKDMTELVKCPDIYYVIIPESVTTIGAYAFSWYGGGPLEIPNGVTTIEENAFEAAEIETIILPDTLVSIGEWAFFYSCLTDVVIPKSVTSIGNYAFDVRHFLKTITIPASVIEIGKGAFGSTEETTIITTPGSAAEAYALQYNMSIQYQ